MGITINDTTITFSKTRWFDEEIQIALCLGFRMQGQSFVADMKKASKSAVFAFMRYTYGNLVNSQESAAERSVLYAKLAAGYDIAYAKAAAAVSALPFNDKLYRHQKEGIAQMLLIKHTLLAFEQGIGKSITAIAVSEIIAKYIDNHRTLIICPASCKYNWRNELIMWGVDATTISMYDSKKKNTVVRENERYAIINYDMLKKYHRILASKGYKHIILDEATAVKNFKSKRYQYTEHIVYAGTPKISMLSGTPIWNRVEDLFGYLKLTRHQLGRNYHSFVSRYTESYRNNWGGQTIVKGQNLTELSAKISNLMIRRRKEDCLDLPAKIYTKYYFEFDQYSAEYAAYIKKLKRNPDEQAKPTSIHTLNILATKSKIKNIIDAVENILESGEKIVVFTSYNEPRKMLEDHFGSRAVTLHGGTPTGDRQPLIDRFTTDPNCTVFIGNMQAAGTGINLQVAHNVLFCNFPLTVSELMQCIDRCVLKGQEVMTKEGFTKIEDIKIGDLVYTHMGNYQKVLDTHSHLEKEKLFIDISYKGYDKPLSVTGDHKIYAYDKRTDDFHWIEARNLDMKYHYLCFPGSKLSKGKLKYLKVVKKFKKHIKNKIPNKVLLTNKLLHAFGWYIAEGWSVTRKFGEKKSARVMICGNLKKEKYKVRDIIKVLSDAFGGLKINEYVKKKTNVVETAIYSTDLATNFKEWFGDGAHEKKFPDWAFNLTKKQIKYMLNGYYAGDGYKRKNTQQASTVSKTLATHLCQLETMLGNPTTLRYNPAAGCYSFEFSIWHRVKRTPLIKNRFGYALRPISEIRIYKPRKGDDRNRVYDLTVENDHSFVVGLASVHNCHRIGLTGILNIYYTICNGSIDESIYEMIVRKSEDIKIVLDGGKDTIELENANTKLISDAIGRWGGVTV